MGLLGCQGPQEVSNWLPEEADGSSPKGPEMGLWWGMATQVNFGDPLGWQKQICLQVDKGRRLLTDLSKWLSACYCRQNGQGGFFGPNPAKIGRIWADLGAAKLRQGIFYFRILVRS